MKYVRILAVFAVCGLMSFTMGQKGCGGGGQLIFGGSGMEETGVAPEQQFFAEEGGPGNIGEIIDNTVTIETIDEKVPSDKRGGEPKDQICALDLVEVVYPMVLSVSLDPAVQKLLMEKLPFAAFEKLQGEVGDVFAAAGQFFDRFVLAMVPEKEAGGVVLFKAKPDIGEEALRFLQEAVLPIIKSDKVKLNAVYIGMDIYAIGSDENLKIVQERFAAGVAKEACTYCGVGIGTANIDVPQAYFSIDASFMNEIGYGVIGSDASAAANQGLSEETRVAIREKFAGRLYVLVNMDESFARMTSALFSGIECAKDDMIGSLSMQLNFESTMGSAILQRVIAQFGRESKSETRSMEEAGLKPATEGVLTSVGNLPEDEIEKLKLRLDEVNKILLEGVSLDGNVLTDEERAKLEAEAASIETDLGGILEQR